MNENNQEPKKIELLKQLISELDDLQQVEINERAFQFNRWLELISNRGLCRSNVGFIVLETGATPVLRCSVQE